MESTLVEKRNDSDSVELSSILGRIKEKWLFVAAAAAIALAVAGAAAFLLPTTYSSAVVVISTTSDRSNLSSALSSSLGSLASIAGLGTAAGDPAVEEALGVLTSREFLERFMAARGLVAKLDLRKSLSGRAPTPARGVKKFTDDILDVSRDKKTGLITITISWRDRVEAANWANDLVARLNVEMAARSTRAANDSVVYLEKEYVKTNVVETKEAIGRLLEAQIKQAMLAGVSREYAFRVVQRALPPDSDDIASPNRVLLLIAGPFIGALTAVIILVLRESWRRS